LDLLAGSTLPEVCAGKPGRILSRELALTELALQLQSNGLSSNIFDQNWLEVLPVSCLVVLVFQSPNALKLCSQLPSVISRKDGC
jgi:hypothetical protein